MIGEIMLLEIAPASLDVVQFGSIFRQPLDGEPGGCGEGTGSQLAAVDRPIVENRDQGSGAFGGAGGSAELVKQRDKVGGALGGASVHEKAPVHPIKGAEHRPLLRLAVRFDTQLC